MRKWNPCKGATHLTPNNAHTHTHTHKLDEKRKLTNLKSGIAKELENINKNVKTIEFFGRLLEEARDKGTDFSIQAYSQSPCRCR